MSLVKKFDLFFKQLHAKKSLAAADRYAALSSSGDVSILQSQGSIFGEQVFLCTQGRRHPVISAERIKCLGFHWPNDLEQVSERVLRSFRPARHVPGVYKKICETENAVEMREMIAHDLTGVGLEVGAGASPFPVPLCCEVLYGDRLSYKQLLGEQYPGQRQCDILIPDVVTDFDELSNIEDETLDFIVTCHVIEHTRNPVGSIVTAHKKLKPGGRLLLVIPDKERTFDQQRKITPLEHFFEDFYSPDRSRDFSHYEEFYRLAMPVPDEIFAKTVREKFEQHYAIHYHVWTHDSFAEMLHAINRRLNLWESVWTHPAAGPPESSNEFYAVLVKES